MATKLTKRTVGALEPRTERYDVYDSELPGFALRVTPNGTKTFAIVYRAGKGRGAPSRRFTIGAYGKLTVDQARDEAKAQLARVELGEDPARDVADEKALGTVAAVGTQFLADVDMRRKETTASEYRRIWDRHVAPALGSRRVDTVTVEDVTRIQRSMRKTPILANRCMAMLGAFFTFADPDGERGNPAHKVEPFPEKARERYLTPDEVQRLGDALKTAEKTGLPLAPQIAKHRKRAKGKMAKHRPKSADKLKPANPYMVAAIRFLLFSGWRENEALTLKWSDLDKARGSATLGDTKTGRSVRHLGAPAWALLDELPVIADNPHVFVGRGDGEHLKDLSIVWYAVRHAARLDDVRLHDLRHSFASTIASSGGSLLLIGKLLGHKNPRTTARYSHLFDDPVRATADATASQLATWLTKTSRAGPRAAARQRTARA
jgi:integrase